MTETSTQNKKKGNPLIFVGIGCLILIVGMALASAFVGKFVASKLASGMISKVIEDKTGMKTNVEKIDDGSMAFTDPKTGASLNVSSGKVPDDFPKDMPMYPGATVTSSLSGGESAKQNGFWLTLTTKDAADVVFEYYKKELATNGWNITANYSGNGTYTQAIEKAPLSGTVSVVSQEEKNDTQIVIILGSQPAE